MKVSSVFSARRTGSPTGGGSEDAASGSGAGSDCGSGAGSGSGCSCSWSSGEAVTTASRGSGTAPASGKDTGSGSGSAAGTEAESGRDSSADSGFKMMGAATAEVEGASAAVVGVDSTGSVVGGATAAELASARSSASVEVDDADEVAAAGASASAELGGSTSGSESGSELPQPAAASAAAVPAAARTHRRHRRKWSRRMHDNKSMVHLSVGTERRSAGLRTGRDGEDGGRGTGTVSRRGGNPPRSAARKLRHGTGPRNWTHGLKATLSGPGGRDKGSAEIFWMKPRCSRRGESERAAQGVSRGSAGRGFGSWRTGARSPTGPGRSGRCGAWPLRSRPGRRCRCWRGCRPRRGR